MATVILSHWHHRFENVQYSSQDFYNSVANRIKDQQFPDVTLQNKEISEGSMLKAKRMYLRVMRHEFTFDICAAPFGASYFVSWWLTETPGCEVALVEWIPFIGKPLARFLQSKTYFETDSEIMFRENIHAILLQSLDQLAAEKGFRALTDAERQVTYIKPIA